MQILQTSNSKTVRMLLAFQSLYVLTIRDDYLFFPSKIVHVVVVSKISDSFKLMNQSFLI